MPNTVHEAFDFFFASYIIEDMESTWVPALIDGNEEWRKLDWSDPQKSYHLQREVIGIMTCFHLLYQSQC